MRPSSDSCTRWNSSLCSCTALNSLTGTVTSPKAMTPDQTGRGGFAISTPPLRVRPSFPARDAGKREKVDAVDELVLSCTDLRKRFGEIQAVSGISFGVAPGE